MKGILTFSAKGVRGETYVVSLNEVAALCFLDGLQRVYLKGGQEIKLVMERDKEDRLREVFINSIMES